MTYIEFFDKNPCENIISCLAKLPERVVLVGNDSKEMKKHAEICRKLFENRGKKVDFVVRSVPKNDISKAKECIKSLVESYDDCFFDITGGNEALIFALGSVCTSEKSVDVHSFNIANGSVFDCDGDGNAMNFSLPKLSVSENIMLYGGKAILKQNTNVPDDINVLFRICRENCRAWNSQMGILAAIEEIGTKDGFTTCADRQRAEAVFSKRRSKTIFYKGLMKELMACGFVTDLQCTEKSVSITYKNAFVKNCLTKAGLVLELKIFDTAKRLTDKNGVPVYNDVQTSVEIDWDGKDLCYDTKNEIDVMMMHGTVPVFVSCKNGMVTQDELYKLNSVAARFGGKFAKKALVVTNLDLHTENGKYLKQRAIDMGIAFIGNISELDDRALDVKIRDLYKS